MTFIDIDNPKIHNSGDRIGITRIQCQSIRPYF
jgi:hypothetical protein